MQFVCAKCRHVVEFSKEPPSFCSRCGQALTETRSDGPADGLNAPTLAPAAAAQASPVPETLGGYRLVRTLGAGGMGAVYEAEEIASGRRVAVKVIGAEYAGSPESMERFRQEGRLASMLGHPRCVFVLAVDEEAGRPYIVMELMPGATLSDLVERQGPLPAGQAIAKILDVIEGLQEAHRLQIVHRDVKPSNCFLEADGRVKVGDFGLAKSLVRDAPHLTRTGAFLGTLYFASPEQVRGDAVGPQTDVYSVAATLYFLLTGKAPFQGSDPAAALARLVSEPAPPMCGLRPELAPALDRIVLRGLERDRERRWPDLESFRQALLSLTPAPLAREDLGPRLSAYLVDFLLLWLIVQGLGMVVDALDTGPGAYPAAWGRVVVQLLGLAFAILYFTVLERTWGCSLGKSIFRLRVGTGAGTDPPSWGPAALRAVVFCGLVQLSFVVDPVLRLARAGEGPAAAPISFLVSWGWWAAGAALVLSTMRAANGYRGMHEVVSATRVVRQGEPGVKSTLRDTGAWLLYFLGRRRLSQGLPAASGIPDRIGGFTIRGVLRWTEGEKVLLGEDASLGRRVFLWLRPQAEAALDRARRDVGRRTRLRWLACGRQGDLQWDALLAASGCPLPELVLSEGKLSWPEVRPLLETLAGELAAACADGTLPGSLSADQVWVQPDGQAQLADIALIEGSPSLPDRSGQTDQRRALALLREVAALALEGRPPLAEDSPAPVQASLPGTAQQVLSRLMGGPKSFETVQQFQADLANL